MFIGRTWKEVIVIETLLIFMAGFSYFIPLSLRSKISDGNGVGSVKGLRPVFSSEINMNGRFKNMTTHENGQCISFLMDEGNNIRHSAVRFSVEEPHYFNHKSLRSDGKHAVSSLGDVAFTATKTSNNQICLTCIKLENSSVGRVSESFYLQYEYCPQFHELFLFADKKICLVTNDSDGARSNLDILTYNVNDRSIDIHHYRRLAVPDVGWRIKVKVYFSRSGAKIFIVGFDDHYVHGSCVFTYSLAEDSFGPVYLTKRTCIYHFYAYHRDIGNMMIICSYKGEIKVLREYRMQLYPLQDGDVDLREYGDHCKWSWRFMHVSYFNKILLFAVLNSFPDELYIFDFSKREFVGKYISPDISTTIEDVKSNWSGQEVFVVTSTKHGDNLYPKLSILFHGETNEISSLKEIAKLAVFQYHSTEELKKMNFPRMLKREMNLLR